MPAPFRFDRTFRFGVAADELWGALSRPDRYREWWAWLEDFDADGGFAPGATARCVIRAPLPYTLRVDVHVQAVEPGTAVDTEIDGDLAGPARLEVAALTPRTSTARLQWTLELRDLLLRRFAVVGRPAMAWAHDQVVAAGLRQFEQRALRRVG